MESNYPTMDSNQRPTENGAPPPMENNRLQMQSSHSRSEEHKKPSTSNDDFPADDPRLPQNWPLTKKIFTSVAAWCFTFTLLNALTSYAAAVSVIMQLDGVGMDRATLPFSLFLFGIFFAPLYTPHVSERIGRTPIYFASTIGMSVFLLGSAYSTSYTSLAVLRFFAGLFGGPIVVNVEGTFADLWDAESTVTYYSFLGAAQYMGASCGPIIAAPVVGATGDWRYTQFIPLMFALVSLLVGFGMPETFPRQIMRNEARRRGDTPNLSPAPSGASIGQILKFTVFDPALMLVSEPLVTVSAIMLASNFGLLFSLFIVVPPVLVATYAFDPAQLGLGFLSGLSGSALALITAPLLEQAFRPLHKKRVGMMKSGVVAVEYRLVPAILGTLFMLAALFWIGHTAAPNFHPAVPVAGTAFYVWGSLMQVISTVSYVFDLYPSPPSILSALTALATTRVFAGGIVSIFFIHAVLNLGGPWAFNIFAIITCVVAVWPVALYFVGPHWRSRSRFAKGGDEMSPATMEAMGKMNGSAAQYAMNGR